MSTNDLSHKSIFDLPANSKRWIGIALGIGLLVTLLDLLSKWLVIRQIGPDANRSHIPIVGDFIELHYLQNSGVAFGLLDGYSTLAGFVVGIVIVPLVVILLLLATRGAEWAVVSGLVLGGAVGNLLDRIGDESVTDFISIGRWPSFNLADTAITIGMLIIIGMSFRDHRTEATDER